MKKIPLTQGKYALVDDQDYDRLVAEGSWHFDRYAKRVNKRVVTYMHRVVMGSPVDEQVDHINGDKLDNRRCNLRVCTCSENLANRHVSRNKYRGVSWDKRRGKWKAVLGFHYSRIDIGRFDTQEEAAEAYNLVARQLFGEYARLNAVE